MPEVVAVEAAEALELLGVLCHEPEMEDGDSGSSKHAGGGDGCLCPMTRLPCSLLGSLLDIQQSFVLSDPRLPDMPIIHASERFLQLTGYSRWVYKRWGVRSANFSVNGWQQHQQPNVSHQAGLNERTQQWG